MKSGIDTHEITIIAKLNETNRSNSRPLSLPKALETTKMQHPILRMFQSIHIQIATVFVQSLFDGIKDLLNMA